MAINRAKDRPLSEIPGHLKRNPLTHRPSCERGYDFSPCRPDRFYLAQMDKSQDLVSPGSMSATVNDTTRYAGNAPRERATNQQQTPWSLNAFHSWLRFATIAIVLFTVEQPAAAQNHGCAGYRAAWFLPIIIRRQ